MQEVNNSFLFSKWIWNSSAASLVKVSAWEPCFVPRSVAERNKFPFVSWFKNIWVRSVKCLKFRMNWTLLKLRVSCHASKLCHPFLHISCKNSLVGKIAWGKNEFLSNFWKSKQLIEIKIKTWYWTLKGVPDLKLSPYLTRSVSRMKW